MSKIKQRNGIWYYHHNEHRFSLKTKDRAMAKDLQDHYDRKRLTGQLNCKRTRILDLTGQYSYHIREEARLADATVRKVVHQVAMFTEYVRNEKVNVYIDEITPDLFHRYARWRDISSVKNDMMALNKMFSWGRMHGLNPEVLVPVADFQIKKSHKHRPISPEEFKMLYGGAHSELYEWLYYTGLRPSDVINISSDNISGRVLRITPQKTSNSSGKEVVIVLHKSLRPPVKGLLFFDYLAGNKTLDQARREIKRILGKGATLYSLRYSFNARLKELGAPLEVRKDAMGHTSVKTTEGYSMADLTAVAGYIDRME